MTENDRRRYLSPGEKVCVIGAGASGLAAAKALRDRNIPYDQFEMGSDIGGVWRYENDTGRSPAYENLHLITSKEHTAFEDFPMPEDIPTYASHREVLRYLEEYAGVFGLREGVEFNTRVERIIPRGGDGWEVALGGEAEMEEKRWYGAVMVCSGHLWKRRWPEFPGSFGTHAIHAREYRRPENFLNQRVLVVGVGNSGCDIAVDLAHTAATVHLSTRSSAWVLPKYLFGIPTDQWTGYYMEYLPLRVRRWFLRLLRWCTIGRQVSYGMPVPDHKVLQEHPTINQYLLSYVDHGQIQIKPDIEQLEDSLVQFEDGTRVHYDAVIYATGYDVAFPFLDDDIMPVVDNRVPLYKSVVFPDLSGLYFIGFLQPLGAIFPLAERQSKWIAALLDGEVALPDRETVDEAIAATQEYRNQRYHESPRHTLEVDFWRYVHQIEKEMEEGRKRIH